ncbi:Xaa-Pro dipeptidyl-peptidase [Bombilactobacillus bombi]|uniref:Xaa-Pro dipeptidyl-peptidase n=1 Tax=Bombilactobacillus bombi TaxID=1303590 RepID=UPI000E584FDF|nr:Xaa-Pro dipeptidyl-peptidase [Bombilactobacillus bombi]AXX64721.1 Xaa-Pro dipeptidyl-peptidase [Bombilactobacillus bombi]
MKLNQFAIKPTDVQQEIFELQQIHFIDADFLDLAPHQALKQLLLTSFPELDDIKSQTVQLRTLMATSHQNAEEYVQQEQITATAFYNLYFQLLGFEVEQDFDLQQPLKIKADVHHPQFVDQQLTTSDLVHGWYQLLITHTVHGQTFLDELASRGYFETIMHNSSKPLIFNGKTQPVFDTNQLLHEVVYVESSLDSDHDGQRDLLKAEIIRPSESNHQPVPVLYTASPYNQGTNDVAGERLTHNVNVSLTPKQPTVSTIEQNQTTSSKIPAPRAIKGQTKHAQASFGNHFSYSLNDYFLARGFAVVYAAGIGTKDSQGMRICGDDQETQSATAIIEWLNGQRTAFTDKTQQISISAWWCNHHIAMTGRSYLGTLATAVATTGVAGLKTIISEAAISSWYDYYRENGLVVAPGGFPGEDADVLAEETFSRQKQAGDYQQIKATWLEQLHQIKQQQDRQTGNYNDFWDKRNYRHNIKKIKADIIMVHGLNDWNVKPKNVYKLWQALKDIPVTKKLILHQGPHIYINNFRSLDYTDMMNLWLTYKLYDVNNQAAQILPDVLIQDNAQAETWHSQTDWGNKNNSHQVYYLQNQQLQTQPAPKDLTPQIYRDYLIPEKFNYYTNHLENWKNDLVQTDSDLAATRLIFKTAPQTETLILDGRPQVKLRLASDHNIGLISCRLIDYGTYHRLEKLPQVLETQAFDLGFHYQKEDLREYQLSNSTSDYQLISLAHMNLQNRTALTQVETVNPGEFYEFTLALHPTHYRLLPGHQLGLIVYATDMEMTIRGNQDIHYQLDCANSKLILPYC